MYRIFLFCLFINISFLSSCGQSNIPKLNWEEIDYPNYETILKKFFEHGKAPKDATTAGYILHFMKKPEGWFVCEIHLETKKIQNIHQFWSTKTQSYIPKAKEAFKSNSQRNIIRFHLNQDPTKSFDANLFYGYKTWADDVIQVLGNKIKISDTFLFSLAEAYAYKANISLGIRKKPFDPIFKTEPKLNEATTNFHKSIATFERVKKKNPNFKCSIGSIDIKTINQYADAYYSLEIAGFPNEAQQFLKHNLYDNFYVTYAKAKLSSCRNNGILFTYGDLDTYPLFYVQHKLNYRKDIFVINVNMLSADWYLKYIFKKIGNLNISPKTYFGKYIDFVILKDSSEKQDFKTISKAFNENNKDYIIDLENDQHFYQVKSHKFQILPTVVLDFEKTAYLTKNHVILLDIIASKTKDYPIHFSPTEGNEYYNIFRLYLTQEGLVSYLDTNTPFENIKEVHIDKTNKILNTLPQSFIKVPLDKNKDREVYFIRKFFTNLALAYAHNNEHKKAIEIAQKSLILIPDKVRRYDGSILSLLELFYKNDMENEANRIIKRFLTHANIALYKPKGKEDEILFYKYECGFLVNVLQKVNKDKALFDEVFAVYKRLEFMVEENKNKQY